MTSRRLWDDEFADERSDYADPEDYHDAVRHRFHVLKMEYGQALNARNLYLKCKLENATRLPTYGEVQLLKRKATRPWVAVTLDYDDSDFYTHREFVDANSACALASSLFEIAEQKYRFAQSAFEAGVKTKR